MTFRTTLLASLVATSAALPASAVCTPQPDTAVPVFEIAKEAMLSGDYDTFYDAATPFVANADEKRASLLGPLQRVMPSGFSGCSSAAFRFEAPGLYQEVVMFETETGPLGLYLLGVMYKGKVQIIHFAYSDSPADMVERLN